MVKIEQEFVDPSEEPHTKIIMLPYTEFITVTNIHNRKVSVHNIYLFNLSCDRVKLFINEGGTFEFFPSII